MKSETGINNRWVLLESVIGISNLKSKFNAYDWYNDEDLKISKDEHWTGWWNSCFNFVSIWAKSENGKRKLAKIKEVFAENGYDIDDCLINGGISILYKTMTKEESHKKAYDNLVHGGRMSD